MATWLKTEDGDLVNLDSGVSIYNVPNDAVRLMVPGEITDDPIECMCVCAGDGSENCKYMSYLEQELIESGQTIIEPGKRFKRWQ